MGKYYDGNSCENKQLPNIIFNSNIICNWIDLIIDGMVDGTNYYTLGLYKIEVVIPIVFTQEISRDGKMCRYSCAIFFGLC